MGRMIPTAASSASVDLTPVTNRLAVMEEAVNQDLTPRVDEIEADLPSKLDQAAVDSRVDAKTASLGSKFRGEWSAGELVWSEAFDAGLPTGAPWTFKWSSNTVGTPAFQVVAMSTSSGSSRPAYANCLRIPSNGARDNDTSQAILDLNAIPALAGKTLTTISFWAVENRQLTGGSPTNKFVDGTIERYNHTVSDNGGYPWVQYTYPLASVNNDLVWSTTVNGSANPNNTYWVAGIQISAVGQPYMLGEFVLYKSKMWKSTANTNTSTPGVSASWVEVPVNSGSGFTTATRPSASASGVGAQIFDTTLVKPVWSDGTVWRDSTGTAV